MRKSLGILLALALALPLSASFKKSVMTETENVRNATEKLVFKHKVSSDYHGTSIEVELKLSDGEAELRALDQEGNVRWRQSFERGDATVQRSFDNTGGWRVELELKKATGRYLVRIAGIS